MTKKILFLSLFNLCVSYVLCIPDQPHPSFLLGQVNWPSGSDPLIGGLGFLTDGRMVLATGTTAGVTGGGSMLSPTTEAKVVIATGYQGANPTLTIKDIANNWRQPTGITIVNDVIYVAERDGHYRITSNDPSGSLSGNRTRIVTWPDASLANGWPYGERWHTWMFTPVYWNGNFYGPYSGSIQPGGPTVNATNNLSGGFLRWPQNGGTLEAFSSGLRSPNGANINSKGQIMVCDNQGSWLPSSTCSIMIHRKFYGHKNGNSSGGTEIDIDKWPYQGPTVWMPHNQTSRSPSQPVYVTEGTYKGNWIYGDINWNGLMRISIDTLGGQHQGAVFHFSKGMGDAMANRLAFGPDGALYIGMYGGFGGNWPDASKRRPMRKLIPKANTVTFEPLAVYARQSGIEIKFTKAFNRSTVFWGSVSVERYEMNRIFSYGGGHMEKRTPLTVGAPKFNSADTRVFYPIATGLQAGNRLYKITVHNNVRSSTGDSMWNNEIFYTMNSTSTSAPFDVPGCTDAKYVEYDPEATRNDGSCVTLGIETTANNNKLWADVSAIGVLTVNVTDRVKDEYKVEVLDLKGRRLGFASGSEPKEFIFSDLPRSAVYLIRVQTSKGALVQRVHLF